MATTFTMYPTWYKALYIIMLKCLLLLPFAKEEMEVLTGYTVYPKSHSSQIAGSRFKPSLFALKRRSHNPQTPLPIKLPCSQTVLSLLQKLIGPQVRQLGVLCPPLDSFNKHNWSNLWVKTCSVCLGQRGKPAPWRTKIPNSHKPVGRFVTVRTKRP